MSAEHKAANAFYLRKNLSLAWPLALNALLMQSMLIIDILIVSPLGEIALAGMGIATTIIAFFIGLQFALGNGTQLIIGRMFGANNTQGLFSAVSCGLVINVLATLGFVLSLVFFSEDLVAVLTADSAIAEQVARYLSVAQYILLFNAVTQVITVLLNGQGNTKTPLKIYLIELPVNALVSYLLTFGIASLSFDGLGLIGAAFGSLVAIVLRLALLWLHIKDQPVSAAFQLKPLCIAKVIGQHFREILPVATNFLVLSVGNTVYQLLFAQLELTSYVAITLVFPWLRIATQFIVAWGQANAITITQAIGQGNTADVQPLIKNAIKLGMLLAIIVAAALYGFSLVAAFIYPHVELSVLQALTIIMPLYVMLPLIRTFNTIAGNCLRAIGQSVYVLKVHAITQWLVVLPLCALLTLYFQLPLFWIFALLLLEELLKALPFYLRLKTLGIFSGYFL